MVTPIDFYVDISMGIRKNVSRVRGIERVVANIPSNDNTGTLAYKEGQFKRSLKCMAGVHVIIPWQ